MQIFKNKLKEQTHTRQKTGFISVFSSETENITCWGRVEEDGKVVDRLRRLMGCNNFIDSAQNSQGSTVQNPTSNQIRDFTIFPNPAQNNVNIAFPDLFSGTVQITDITGKAVWSQTGLVDEKQYTVLLDRFNSGLYIVQAIDNSQSLLYQQKLIVEK